MSQHRTAFLFDLNGTMIHDMEFHLQVWYDIIVHDLGAKMSLEEVKSQLYGKSQEILVRIFGEQKFTVEELNRISFQKEKRYQYHYRPHLDLIPGLFAFLEQAYEQKIPMAIGSAAIPLNIDFVLDHLKIHHYFNAIVSADDVVHSKPHPETYLKAASKLQVEPQNCIVFEDVPKGVESALNAGMKAVVITSTHQKQEFSDFDNILCFIGDYHQLSPSALISKNKQGHKYLGL